jgi:DNA-directed RNA polymerase omega subunit
MMMQPMNETSWNNFGKGQTGQGVDSMYQLIIVAAQRNKQLVRGAAPRISPGPRMHRNTTIAIEEARRGLVPFTMDRAKEKDGKSGDGSSKPVDSAVATAGVPS